MAKQPTLVWDDAPSSTPTKPVKLIFDDEFKPASSTVPSKPPAALAPAKRLGKTRTVSWLGESNLPVVGQYKHPGGSQVSDVISYPAPTKENPGARVFLVPPSAKRKPSSPRDANILNAPTAQTPDFAPMVVEQGPDGSFVRRGSYRPAAAPVQQAAPAQSPAPEQPRISDLMRNRETVEQWKSRRPKEVAELERDYTTYAELKDRNPMLALQFRQSAEEKYAKLQAELGSPDQFISQQRQVEMGMLTPPQLAMQGEDGRTASIQSLRGSDTQGAQASQLGAGVGEQAAQYDDAAARVAAQRGYVSGNAAGRTAQAFGTGVESVAAGAARLLPGADQDLLNEVSRNQASFQQAAGEQAGGGWLNAGVERAGQGIAQSYGVVAPGAALGAVTGGAATGMALATGLAQYGQAYQQATDAGLRGADREQFATVNAAAESLMSLAFTKLLKMPGLEGAFAKGGLSAETVKGVLWKAAQTTGRSGLEELPEEVLTQIVQNVNTRMSGVDPSKKVLTGDELFDIAVQSMGAAGGARAIGIAPSIPGEISKANVIRGNAKAYVETPTGPADWAKSHPMAAEEIAAVVQEGKPVSRAMMEANSLPTMDSVKRSKWAADVHAAVKNQVADAAGLGEAVAATPDATESQNPIPAEVQRSEDLRGRIDAERASQAAAVRNLGPEYEQRAQAIEAGSEDAAIAQDIERRMAEEESAPFSNSPKPKGPAFVNNAQPIETAAEGSFGAPQTGDEVVDTREVEGKAGKGTRRGRVVSVEGDWATVQPKFGKQYKVPVGRLEVRGRPGTPKARGLQEQPVGEGEDFVTPMGGSSMSRNTVASQDQQQGQADNVAQPDLAELTSPEQPASPAQPEAEVPPTQQAEVGEPAPAPQSGVAHPSGMSREQFEAAAIPAEVAKEMTTVNRAGDARSKNKGERSGALDTGPLVEVQLPVSLFASDYLQYLKESTDADRVGRYETQSIATPIYALPRKSMRKNAGRQMGWQVSDGGHRLLAAIARGDSTIRALVPVSSYDAMAEYPANNPAKTASPAPPHARQVEMVQAAFPGQEIRPHATKPDAWQVTLRNGKSLTVEFTTDMGPISREGLRRSLEAQKGRAVTDAEIDAAQIRGRWRVSDDAGLAVDGQGLVRLNSTMANSTDAKHEALHAARSLGLFTDAEWNALKAEHAPNAKTEGDAEEAIAYAAQAWAGPKGLLAKILQFFNGILSSMKVVNPSADTALKRLRSGKVFGREGKTESRKEAAARLSAEVSGDVRYAAAFHGSPHTFPKFSSDKIGTGEGDQARGHGLYYASAKAVGESYRDLLSKSWEPINQKIDSYLSHFGGRLPRSESDKKNTINAIASELPQEASDLLRALDGHSWMDMPPSEAVKASLGGSRVGDLPSDVTKAADAYKKKYGGRLYEVDLKPKESEYLLWDEPVKKQSAIVRDAIRHLIGDSVDENMTGGEVYGMISRNSGGPYKASMALLNAGVRGNKYLDGTSRSQGEGSHNYVIFDDADVDITEMYSAATDPSQAKKERVASLANPGMSPDVRNQIDAERLAMDAPETQPLAEVQRLADAITPDQVRAALASGKPITAPEMEAARRLKESVTRNALVNRTAANLAESAKVIAQYDLIGTESARAFNIRRDRVETPFQRNQRLLGDELIGAPKSIRDAIKDALRLSREALLKGDKKTAKAERDRATKLSREGARMAEKNRAFLERIGLLPKDGDEAAWNEIFGNDIKSFRLLREASALNQGYGSAIMEYWNSLLLSGPATQFRNLLGTPLNYSIEAFIERPILAAARVAIGKQSASDTLRAANEWWKGFSLSGAWRHAVDSYRQETSTFDRLFKDEDYGGLLENMDGYYSIRGLKGRVIRGLGWGPLRAADQFWKALIGGMEVGRFAYAQARSELGANAKSEDISNRMAEIMADYQSDAWEKASARSDIATFTEKGSETRHQVKQRVKALRNVVPGAKFIIPFIDTPVNIAAQTIERAPVLGAIRYLFKMRDNIKNKRPTFDGLGEAAVKQLVSTAALTALLQSGLLSDDDDKYFAIRSGQHADPLKRYTFKWGDTDLSYQGLEPVASLLSLMADWNASRRSGVNPGTVIVGSTIDQIANKPMLQGLGDILQIMNPRDYGTADSKWKTMEANGLNYAKNFGASWVPAIYKQTVKALRPNAVNTRIMATDAEGKDKWTLAGKRMVEQAELGWMLEKAGFKDPPAAQIDVFGKQKSNVILDGQSWWSNPGTDFLYRLTSPLRTTEQNAHPANELLAAWNRTKPEGVEDYKLSAVEPRYTDSKGKPSVMDEHQFEQLQKLAGGIADKLYAKGKFDPKNPTEAQVAMLTERLLPAAKEEARRLVVDSIVTGKPVTETIDQIAERVEKKVRVSVFNAASEKVKRTMNKGEVDWQRDRRVEKSLKKREVAREQREKLRE